MRTSSWHKEPFLSCYIKSVCATFLQKASFPLTTRKQARGTGGHPSQSYLWVSQLPSLRKAWIIFTLNMFIASCELVNSLQWYLSLCLFIWWLIRKQSSLLLSAKIIHGLSCSKERCDYDTESYVNCLASTHAPILWRKSKALPCVTSPPLESLFVGRQEGRDMGRSSGNILLTRSKLICDW